MGLALRKRLGILDALRGVNFISMALYHAMYDIAWIFDKNGDYSNFKGTPGFVWQQIIAMTFIVISGFSAQLGRKSLRRGVIVFASGVAVSAATMIFYPSETIKYGILTFMGTSMIAVSLLDKFLKKIPYPIGMIAALALFTIFRNIDSGYLWLLKFRIAVPKFFYNSHLLAGFGFPYSGFYSSDYFPFLPWFFLYLFGYFIAKPLLLNEKVVSFLSHDMGIISVIGRHTLGLYMLHQPVIFLLLSAWFSFFGKLM